MIDLSDMLLDETVAKVQRTWGKIEGKEVECQEVECKGLGLVSYLRVWKGLYMTFASGSEHNAIRMLLDDNQNRGILQRVADGLMAYKKGNFYLKISPKYERILQNVRVGHVSPNESGIPELAITANYKVNPTGVKKNDQILLDAIYDNAVKPTFAAILST